MSLGIILTALMGMAPADGKEQSKIQAPVPFTSYNSRIEAENGKPVMYEERATPNRKLIEVCRREFRGPENCIFMSDGIMLWETTTTSRKGQVTTKITKPTVHSAYRAARYMMRVYGFKGRR